jgi:hypothetical protein
MSNLKYYAVYPGGRGKPTLKEANAIAREQSRWEGEARVENTETGKTISRFNFGAKMAKPGKGVR